MKNPSFYGVDIVLLPEKLRGRYLHEQGKVIEINGSNSGMSAYKIGEFGVYERVMREVSSIAGNKPIMFHLPQVWQVEFPKSDIPSPTSNSRRDGLERYNFVQASSHVTEDPEYDAYGSYVYPQPYLYFDAGRRLGLNVRECSSYIANHGVIQFTFEDETAIFAEALRTRIPGHPAMSLDMHEEPSLRYETLPIKDIGFMFLTDQRPGKAECFGRERIFNGDFSIAIANNKMFAHFLDDVLGVNPLEKFMPNSMIYGMGLHSKQQFSQWLAQLKSDVFVSKQFHGAHGMGVHFHTKKNNPFPLSPFISEDFDTVHKGYTNLLLSVLLDFEDINQGAILLQDAVPSKRVRDPQTGRFFNACARALVVNGKYMGAIWRSNKKNTQDNASLDEMLRHNITNGAHVLPVNEKDDKLIGEIAEASVAGLENMNSMAEVVLTSSLKIEPTISQLVYVRHLLSAARDSGHELLPSLNQRLDELEFKSDHFFRELLSESSEPIA